MTTAGLAIVNARVWTGDPRRPWADAALMLGETLAAVGSSAEVRKRAGADTVTIDANGTTVVPSDLAAVDRDASPTLPGAPAAMLRAGLPASLVMLDRPLARVDAASVREARIVLLITAGRVVEDPHGLTLRP